MKNRKNLTQLAHTLAAELNMDPTSTKVVLDCFLRQIKKELRSGSTVTLSGFGSFRGYFKSARRVRNPRIAEGPQAFKQVAAKTVYRFRPGSGLKDDAGRMESE